MANKITIETPNAADIRRVALIRNGSSTHAFNPDQRYVALNFDHGMGNMLVASIPNDPSILPTGLLYALDR
jgi:hypothetical protein